MNNRLLLAQSRRGITEHIAQSPSSFTVNRYPQISDGFGGYCNDLTGTPMQITIIGRIAKESRIVSAIVETSAGMDTAATMYLLTEWTSSVKEGDTLTGYRIGKVTPLIKFGGVQALECALYPS